MKKTTLNGVKRNPARRWRFLAIQIAFLAFGTGAFSQTNCLPTFQYNADGNMITLVEFNTISNISPFTSGTTPQYENFTTMSTDVTIGQTYPIKVKGPSSTFPSDVVVFIDWNKNGEFDEPGTYIGSIAPANPANAFTITANITIPATASVGTTKMRIVKNTNTAALSNPAAPNTIASACDASLRAGQTEDYSLNILPGTPVCSGDPGMNPGDLGCVSFTYNGQTTDYTTVRAADGNIWLQQNLGSGQVASASNDATAYGDLFQWGRSDDGHQKRNSTISTTAPSPNNPTGLAGNNTFLNSTPAWWNAGAETDTWNAETATTVTVTNGCDPCKALGNNWQLPSSGDWQRVLDNESVTNVLSAFQSNLKLAVGGTRNPSGTFDFVGVRGYYWSNTTTSIGGKLLYYSNFIVNPNAGYPRSQGGAIRCVKMIPVVNEIEVSIQNNLPATITTNNGTLQAVATITPATVLQDVTWTIVNGTGTATISTTGLVTAQTNGTVWAKAVAAVDPLLKDSIQITISGQTIQPQNLNVTTLNNALANITTNLGTLPLQAIILPAAADQSVTWSIVNGTGTASISTTGLVTAQTNGTVWVKAISIGNPALKDSILVTISGQIVQVQSIDVVTQNNVPASIAVNNGTLQLKAIVLPAAANQNVTWSIAAGTGTATISATGLITAQTNGTVWAKAVSIGNPLLKDSIQINISAQSTAGLTEQEMLPVNVYPNPSQKTINLVYGQEHPAMHLSVTDITGKVVLKQNIQTNELNTGLKLDIEFIDAGIYYIRLQNESAYFIQKIIKE